MKKIIFMFLIFVSTLFANIGTITLLEGEAFVQRGQDTLRLNLSDQISNNDFIETKTNSKVKITFIDNTIITIGKESSLKIEDYFFDSNNKSSAKTELSVSKGAFHAITGQIGKVNPEKFKLKTKNATIGIRGTEIYGDQNRVFCTQGAIYVLSFGETREISQGFFINTFNNQSPSEVIPIDTQNFNNMNSQLNNSTLMNNQNSDNFNNTSDPLAFQNNQAPLINQNQDNQNSWGYWASNIQNENNDTKISNSISNSISNINSNNSLSLTDPAYIQRLLDDHINTTTLLFSGYINQNTLNTINFQFDFGGRNLQAILGDFTFDEYNDIRFTGTINANGFIIDGGGVHNGMDFNYEINGNFYGSEISSVSGDININNGSKTGTFNANKVP